MAALARGTSPSLPFQLPSRTACISGRPRPAARSVVGRRTCTPPSHLHAAAAASAAASELEDALDAVSEVLEPEFQDDDDGVGLTTRQVEALLRTLCEDTTVVDLKLQMGGFSLKVRRSLTGGMGNDPAPTAAAPASPVATQSFDFMPAGSPDASMQSTLGSTMSFEEEDESESLVYVEAPKVGVLRLGKYVKGKRIGKGNIVSEGDQVKKGQHVGYVEQLGTFVPVEAPQAGEVVAFVVEEGKPVEYGEVVVELAPFFGGHIIGDRKHA